jgi:hypothetical protein
MLNGPGNQWLATQWTDVFTGQTILSQDFKKKALKKLKFLNW